MKMCDIVGYLKVFCNLLDVFLPYVHTDLCVVVGNCEVWVP
jgi:hypothetical protein